MWQLSVNEVEYLESDSKDSANDMGDGMIYCSMINLN